jgi:hypothetical protein
MYSVSLVVLRGLRLTRCSALLSMQTVSVLHLGDLRTDIKTGIIAQNCYVRCNKVTKCRYAVMVTCHVQRPTVLFGG